VYVSSRKEAELRATAEQIGAVALPADLATPEGCRALAEAVAEREDAVHVLVNNAGATWGAPLEDYPSSAWDKVLSTNVQAPFLLTQALLGPLRAAATPEDPARVIMIGSIDGLTVPRWQNYAYSASKSAVHQLTRHLAADLAPEVTVNAIAPGLFPSKMTAFAFEGGAEEQIVQHIPMRRAGRPSDVAGLTLFLAGAAGSFMTGAVLPLDGGSSLRS
jgi:NAD(P)-dependent dehydrogenase (short-subunit alcohol dehydrogenase family)